MHSARDEVERLIDKYDELERNGDVEGALSTLKEAANQARDHLGPTNEKTIEVRELLWEILKKEERLKDAKECMQGQLEDLAEEFKFPESKDDLVGEANRAQAQRLFQLIQIRHRVAEACAKLNERGRSIHLHEEIRQDWEYLPDEFGIWSGCECAINQPPASHPKPSNLEQKLRQDGTVAQPPEDLYRANETRKGPDVKDLNPKPPDLPRHDTGSPRPKKTRQRSDLAQIQRSQTLPTQSTETRNITQFLKAMRSWLEGAVVQNRQKGHLPNILEAQTEDRENDHEQPLSSQAHDIPSEEANSIENDDEDEPCPEWSGMYDLDLETKERTADRWFSDLKLRTHRFLYGEKDRYMNAGVEGQIYTRVRIAILDTGIAIAKGKPKLVRFRQTRIRECRSFLEGCSAGDEDDDGHGTAAAILLLKVCPNADIYVARVAQCSNGDVDRGVVSEALRYAVDEDNWNVDIISMSFGWLDEDDVKLNDAIDYAKRQGVLLFAATSNEGIRNPEGIPFPASSPHVISVDSADGQGENSGFNPPSNSDNNFKVRFTAPGERVNCAWPLHLSNENHVPGQKRMTGTSFATPIAAGTAALVLEFSRQPPLALDPTVEKRLKTVEGMREVFSRLMSEEKNAPIPLRFLYPWKLLTGNKSSPYGGDAYDIGSPRYNVARKIVECLQRRSPSTGFNMFRRVMEHIQRQDIR